MGFYEVKIDGVKYKCQGHSREDALEGLREHYIGPPWSKRTVNDTIKKDSHIEVWETD